MRSLAIFALVLATAVGAPVAGAECRPGAVELRGDFGQARFRVEVADDGEERMVGLMNRPEMAVGAGMLFVYPKPQRTISFWMRNTLIPLDILFFDATGTMTARQLNAVPLDETMLDGGTDVQYVLEINGGLAERMGLDLGTQLRHPAIDPDLAAWGC